MYVHFNTMRGKLADYPAISAPVRSQTNTKALKKIILPKDAVLFDDGVAEEFPQFVNFFPG
ncbi:MAG TPA: hypothetical protein VFC17_01050 [Candidatus Limnocylindrales bacterium]|nr:hypothetical protein [Candidatus Limnocylindrales bacterium]